MFKFQIKFFHRMMLKFHWLKFKLPWMSWMVKTKFLKPMYQTWKHKTPQHLNKMRCLAWVRSCWKLKLSCLNHKRPWKNYLLKLSKRTNKFRYVVLLFICDPPSKSCRRFCYIVQTFIIRSRLKQENWSLC